MSRQDVPLREASACAAPVSFPLCANLTAASQAQWVAGSNGQKRDFFKHVQRATPPYNLTGGPRKDCSVLVGKDAAQIRVAFIGDSIVLEMMSVLQTLLGPALSPTYFFLSDLETGTNSGDVNAELLIYALQNNKTFALNIKSAKLHWPLWKLLAAEHWDAVFVGGLGLHRLFRHGHGQQWESDASRLEYNDHNNRTLHSPYKAHRALLSTWLHRFTCFSRALRVPFVFVGTLPVDEPVVLLEPPKYDWDDFHDTQLTQVMSLVERELESKFADLRFLHPSLLANACPGARCDGVHYGSQFDSGAADYGCHATPALWCPLLSQFMRCRLPSLLAGDVHAHRADSSMPMTRPETHFRTHRLHQCLRSHVQ